MFFLREIYSHLRAGFRSETSFLLACFLLGFLDIGAGLLLIWYFLFRHDLPIHPTYLLGFSSIYILGAWMIAMLAGRFSRLMSVKSVSLFYVSVGLFIFLYGLMDMSGRTISVWPWLTMWCVTLVVVLANLGREFEQGRPSDPPV